MLTLYTVDRVLISRILVLEASVCFTEMSSKITFIVSPWRWEILADYLTVLIGLTMSSLLPVLEARGTNSVRVTSLLEKRTERSCGFKADYVGFSIPDKFVIGYCLDFNEYFRCDPIRLLFFFFCRLCCRW